MVSDRGTLPRGAVADQQTSWAEPTAPGGRRLPSAPRERKPALAALAVLLVALGAVAAGYLVISAGHRVGAVEITQEVGQGQQIPASAINEVEIASNTGLNYVAWQYAGRVTGVFAAVQIPAGTLLTPAMTTSTNNLAAGKVEVGLSLKAARCLATWSSVTPWRPSRSVPAAAAPRARPAERTRERERRQPGRADRDRHGRQRVRHRGLKRQHRLGDARRLLGERGHPGLLRLGRRRRHHAAARHRVGMTMALIAIASDKGAPGVTTAALALAAVWPRPVLLAECDPAGGDLVYRFPAVDGGRLDPRRGVLSLAVVARRGMQPQQVWEHAQKLHGGLDVLAGVTNAEQGAGLSLLWGPIGKVLASLPQADVIADCGRLGADGPLYDLLAEATAVVLVTKVHVADVIRLRDRAAAFAAAAQSRGRRGFGVGVVVVADHKRFRASLGEVQHVLGQANAPATVLGGIAHDPKGADLLSGEWGGSLDRTLLIKTARDVAQHLVQGLPPIGAPPAPARPAARHRPARSRPVAALPPAVAQPRGAVVHRPAASGAALDGSAARGAVVHRPAARGAIVHRSAARGAVVQRPAARGAAPVEPGPTGSGGQPPADRPGSAPPTRRRGHPRGAHWVHRSRAHCLRGGAADHVQPRPRRPVRSARAGTATGPQPGPGPGLRVLSDPDGPARASTAPDLVENPENPQNPEDVGWEAASWPPSPRPAGSAGSMGSPPGGG